MIFLSCDSDENGGDDDGLVNCDERSMMMIDNQ